MKHLLKKHYKKNIKYFNKNEKIRLLFKSFFSDLRLNTAIRFYFNLWFFDSKRTKVRFRCFSTYKASGLVSFLKSYRMVVRRRMSDGMYSGFRKSSW